VANGRAYTNEGSLKELTQLQFETTTTRTNRPEEQTTQYTADDLERGAFSTAAIETKSEY
jgi:hypothetical protein